MKHATLFCLFVALYIVIVHFYLQRSGYRTAVSRQLSDNDEDWRSRNRMSGGEVHEDVTRWSDATDEHAVPYSRKEEVMIKSRVYYCFYFSSIFARGLKKRLSCLANLVVFTCKE